MSTPNQRAVILGGNRIPFARSNKQYAKATNLDMLTSAIDGLVARFGLAGANIGEVAGGAVRKHSKDFNLTREAVLGSSLAPTTPAFDLGQACATGLEAVVSLNNKINAGQIESGIASGVDSASDAPIVVNDSMREILLELSRAKTMVARAKIAAQIRPAHLSPQAPSTGEPRTGLSMVEHQATTTRQTRDELAVASHRTLAAACDSRFFTDLTTADLGVSRDTDLRPASTMESLAKLSPVFGKKLEAEPTMTAGNSTPLTDGASSV